MTDFRVNVTNRGVMCEHPDDQFQQLLWTNLHAVAVQTIDHGTHLSDATMRFWMLYDGPVDSAGFMLVPWGSVGEEALQERLLALPSFNREQFQEAKFCTEAKTFLCWQRPEPQSQP